MEQHTPLLTAKECAAFMRISLPTFYRRIADGTLPKPLKLGQLSRWERSDITAALNHAKNSVAA